MRLVAAPDGQVNRLDRALWLTAGFDLSWAGAPVTTAAGRALGPFVGRLGRAFMARAAGVGPSGRLVAQGARAGELGRRLAVGATTGSAGRGASAGAPGLGRLERDELAGGPVGGSF